MGNEELENDEGFQPKGAIAFFVVLMVLFTIIWFALYFEMLGRV